MYFLLFFFLTSLGKEVPNILVYNYEGRKFPLLSFSQGRPLILSPIYTRCPHSCSLITAKLKSLIMEEDSLKDSLGKKYFVLSFTFDERDTIEDLKHFSQRWNLPKGRWEIVKASNRDTKKLLDALDFSIEIDPETGDIYHPNLVFVISPEGKVAHFLPIFSVSSSDIKIALEKSSQEEVTFSLFSHLLSRCYRYNPSTGRYEIDKSLLMHLITGGSFFLTVFSLFFIRYIKRRYQAKKYV